jgi:hypothetical protein
VYTLKALYRDWTTQVASDPVDFMARLAALVFKPRVNLTCYQGVLAPNHRWHGMVTPAKRGYTPNMGANAEENNPIERHAATTWAQRLKRVLNIDIEICGPCGGSLQVIACIEDQVGSSVEKCRQLADACDHNLLSLENLVFFRNNYMISYIISDSVHSLRQKEKLAYNVRTTCPRTM